MAETDKSGKGVDLLGIAEVGKALAPLSKAALKVTESAIGGAEAFLGRICLPAAEEFGLLVRDRVSHWRACNAAAIAEKAQAKLEGRDTPGLHAHPRLVSEVIGKGSWTDDDALQDMWAGLLASSCTENADDSNLIFTGLLGQLTSLQVIVLNLACTHSIKYTRRAGFAHADPIRLTLQELESLTGVNDKFRLDRELDHLRSLNLTGRGFHCEKLVAEIGPSPLALAMYVRCQGFIGSPVEFWDLKPKGKQAHGSPA